MKKIYKHLVHTGLFGLMFSVLFVAGCNTGPSTINSEPTNGSTTNQPMEKRIVKIGVIAPLSGPGSDFGEDVIYPIKTTVDEYNSKISKKYKINLIVEDGKCNGSDATSAVQKLISIDKVDMIIGGVCGSETVVVAKIAQEKKVIVIAPTTLSSKISDMGDYIFRFRKAQDTANILADYINKKGLGHIAIIMENAELPQDFVNNLKKYLHNTKEFVFDSSEKDLDILVKQINKEQFSGLLISTKTTSSLTPIFKALKKNGLVEYYKGSIFGDVMLISKNFHKTFSGETEGFTFPNVKSVINIGSKGAKYLSNIDYKYKVLELQIIFPKEAIDLMLDGIDAGNTTSDQMKTYLESIDKHNQRDGMFGKYYFDKNGDAVGIQYIIQQIQSGQVVPIE